MLKFFTFSFIFFLPVPSFSQKDNATIEKMIQAEVDMRKKRNFESNDYRFDSSNEKHFLNFIKRYENDTLPRVYFLVQSLRAQIGRQTKDTLLKQEIVEDFIQDCSLTDIGTYQYAISRLLYFKEADFSPKAKEMLVGSYNKTKKENEFILVCGTAQVKELIPQLKKLAAFFDRRHSSWFIGSSWNANLALARMNDSAKIDEMIAAVELELNASQRLQLLRKLAYTKYPDCIVLLQKYLRSTERIAVMSNSNDDSKGVEYSQFAMNYLAEYLDDFPAKYKKAGAYTKQEIDEAKKFLQSKYFIIPKG